MSQSRSKTMPHPPKVLKWKRKHQGWQRHGATGPLIHCCISTLEKCLAVLFKVTTCPLCDPALPFLSIHPTDVHTQPLHKTHTWMFIAAPTRNYPTVHHLVKRPITAYSHNRTLLCKEDEWYTTTHNNIGESHKYNVEQNEPVMKECMLYDPLIWNSKQVVVSQDSDSLRR